MRKTPLSVAAQHTSGSLGSTASAATRDEPNTVVPVGLVQVAPESVLTQTPDGRIDSPPPVDDSPVPAHTVAGRLGAIAIAPIESDGSSCQSGNQVSPASIVLKMPPDAGPAYITRWSPVAAWSTAMHRTRPPTLRGPIGTQLCAPATAVRPPAPTVSATPGRVTAAPIVPTRTPPKNSALTSRSASNGIGSTRNAEAGATSSSVGSGGVSSLLIVRRGDRGGGRCLR